MASRKTAYEGKNIYQKHLRIGKILSDRIAKLDGVIGILGTGSIGRKYGDPHSDLDFIVYAKKEYVKSIEKLISYGWIAYKGVSYDLVVAEYEKACRARVPSSHWTQLRRWDFQYSQILHDTRGRVKKLLKEKLVYPDSEQEKLLKHYYWEIMEHLVFYPELWRDRGNLYNISDTLIRASQNIILWYYAKHKLFEPYIPKWSYFHFETRNVPRPELLKKIIVPVTNPVKSLKEAFKIRESLIDICQSIGIKFEMLSSAEADIKMEKNWEQLPDKVKELLSW